MATNDPTVMENAGLSQWKSRGYEGVAMAPAGRFLSCVCQVLQIGRGVEVL
jgi:hypothetical protein